jgi:hypothetical protein
MNMVLTVAEDHSLERLMEIIRQVVLFSCLILAIYLILLPEPALLSVKSVDFEKMQKEGSPGYFAPESEKLLPLDEYIALKTDGRIVTVEGQKWQELYENALFASEGFQVSNNYLKRLESGYFRDSLYFKVNEEPVKEVASGLGYNEPFTYVAIKSGNKTSYMSITYKTTNSAIHYAPSWIMYPYRLYGLLFLAAGLLSYILLPWPERRPGLIYYSRIRAVILPDLIACILGGMFFGLPLLIIAYNSPQWNIFDIGEYGWGFLTITGWLFATGIFISFGLLAANYSYFRIEALKDRLLKKDLLSTKEYPFSDILSIMPIEYAPPSWLTFASAINPGTLARALVLYGSSEGLEISMKDGTKLQVWLKGIKGLDKLLEAVSSAGIIVIEK